MGVPAMREPRPSGHTLRQLRALVVARDGAVCARCGMTIDTGLSGNHPRGLTLGHAWDRAGGGSDLPDNLRPEHRVCNRYAYPPTALTRPLMRGWVGGGRYYPWCVAPGVGRVEARVTTRASGKGSGSNAANAMDRASRNRAAIGESIDRSMPPLF